MATARKTESPSTAIGGIQASGLPVVLTIAAMVVAVAALLPLLQSSDATSIAGRVHQLEVERDGWQAQLHEAELDAAQLGSLDRIEQEARTRLGMEEPKEIRYVPVNAPAPQPHDVPARYLPAQPKAGGPGSSLWEDLFGWVPLP